MDQREKAECFTKLHAKKSPLVLYNAWDAGSAQSIRSSGAKAIATSSWAMAAAHGYEDGEVIPLEFFEQIVGRIASTVDLPLTVDFEGGYSDDDAALTNNFLRLLELGIVGINFEDRIVKGEGLYALDRQTRRISVLRTAAHRSGVPAFINARTDLFLAGNANPAELIGQAIDRGKAYAAAGASGFFVPGLKDDSLIRRICESVSLPVNVMVMDGMPRHDRLSKLGVARISYGPIPFINAMTRLKSEAQGTPCLK